MGPTILFFALLIGLTTFVPLPYADNWARAYFHRRMVYTLADLRKVRLSRDDLGRLAEEQNESLIGGFVQRVFFYPIKWIWRNALFVLEAKRFLDLTTDAYIYGVLLDYALGRDWVRPGDSAGLQRLREAILKTREGSETAVVRDKLEASLSGTMRTLPRLAFLVFSSIRGRISYHGRGLMGALREGLRRAPAATIVVPVKPDEVLVDRAFEESEGALREELAGVVLRMQKGLATIPDDFYQQMEREMAARLGASADAPPNPMG